MVGAQFIFKVDMPNLADLNDILDMIFEEYKICGDRQYYNKAINGNARHCLVMRLKKEIVGFVIYEISATKVATIKEILVDKEYKRQGIGRELINVITNNPKYASVETVVNERNMNCQLFLRACGFKCSKQLKAEFENNTVPVSYDDGYLFSFIRKE